MICEVCSNKLCSNLELLKLPDCYGLLEKGKCRCLDVPNCQGEKCSCYHNSRKKAFARLRSLDEKKQEHISKKYYYGKRPWAEFQSKTIMVKQLCSR